MKDNIFRSKYKIVRKLRIMYLLFRKSTKQCYQPFQIFQNKFVSAMKNILDPIPVILPYNNFSLGWDLVILVMILINVIKIPYELAFNNGEFSVGMITYISKTIFFFDFFMMFNTAFYENGVLEKQRSKIFIHFLKKRLIIEGCTYACLWFNPLGIKFYDSIEKLVDALQLSYKYNFIVKLIVLFIEVVLLCHLFACIWYSIGNYQVQNGQPLNWIQKFSTEHNDQYQQYIDSIYFSVVTIGTIGYGDVVPVSVLEKGCLTAMAIFSCGIFAYILSNIQNVYREYQMKQEGYLNKLIKLNNYMFNREVNPNLQQMARKYLEYVHEQGFQPGFMPCDTLNSLSSSLRQEIKEDIFKKSIANIKYLQNYSASVKIQLSRKMTEINYGPDEFIMKKGQQQPPRLYFILKGQVEVCLDKGFSSSFQSQNMRSNELFCVQKQNDVLGLFEFTCQSQICTTNARSIGVTTAHVLALDDFLEVINQNSQDKEIYYQQKDKINLYQYYGQAKLFCYSCKSSQHLINDCPIFFYKPNNQRIINYYIKEQIQLKKNIRNKSNNRFNSLAIFNSLKQDIKEFQEQNDSEINSLYESQSTLNDLSLQNIDGYESLLNQQSNLSPLKPNGEVNLRLVKYRKSQQEDQNKELDEMEKNNFEIKDKIKQTDLSLLEQKLSENNTQAQAYEQLCQINKVSQKDYNHLKSTQENINQEKEVVNNNEAKQRKSLNISVIIPKRNSKVQDAKKYRNSLNDTKLSSPEKKLSLLNQKQILQNCANSKENIQESNKNIKSSTSFQNLSKHVKNKNVSFSDIQKALNYITTTIVKKDKLSILEEVQEELIIDTIRSYQFYMVHNNASAVINRYNTLQSQIKEKQKQRIQEVFSSSVQNRSICQKI